MTVHLFPFIPQQQKRYQKIKSSALVIQSYIRGWKVSYGCGSWASPQRVLYSGSLCRGRFPLFYTCAANSHKERVNISGAKQGALVTMSWLLPSHRLIYLFF